MITAYAGLPGSGKSYGVVANVILPALKKGRDVWTNIPINAEAMIQEAGKTVTQFNISDIEQDNRWFLETLPKGAICVLDEAWRLWPSGLKANNAIQEHKEYMAEIRHLVNDAGYSSQLCIVTQDLGQLAAFARQLIETTFIAYKLKVVGAKNSFRIDMYQGAVTGFSPPKRLQVNQEFGKYSNDIFKLYKSHTKSDGGAGNEDSVDKRANVFNRMIFKFLPVIFILAIWYLWYAGNKLYAYFDHDAAQPVQSTTVVQGDYVASPKPKPKRSDFFKDRETYISFNMGKGGSTIYRFVSVQGDSFVELTTFEVRGLGYDVRSVNNCLVFFVFEDNGTRYPVTCRQSSSKREFLGIEYDKPVSGAGA